MSDWQVGDLALCVRGGDTVFGVRSGHIQIAPQSGTVHTVERVRVEEYHGLLMLGAKRWTGYLEATRFVKVTPPEADEYDHETLVLEQTA